MRWYFYLLTMGFGIAAIWFRYRLQRTQIVNSWTMEFCHFLCYIRCIFAVGLLRCVWNSRLESFWNSLPTSANYSQCLQAAFHGIVQLRRRITLSIFIESLFKMKDSSNFNNKTHSIAQCCLVLDVFFVLFDRCCFANVIWFGANKSGSIHSFKATTKKTFQIWINSK